MSLPAQLSVRRRGAPCRSRAATLGVFSPFALYGMKNSRREPTREKDVVPEGNSNETACLRFFFSPNVSVPEEGDSRETWSPSEIEK